ncbi:MAG: aminotransferase class I/II-fold pyridoxal phosphate-dependent enzyme [Syntrophorhabdaceae bacterium]|nr:aminotransferase class I/II-fold pyridoxal phosphate-dependent enzyme [Syntrophorhabdaceae bacterium]
MDIHRFASKRKIDLRHLIDLSSDVNPLGPSNKAKHGIRKAIKYLSFPPDDNLTKLKRYIGKRENIEEDQLIFSASIKTLLYKTVMAHRPKNIVVFSPLPETYKRMFAQYENLSPPVNIIVSEEGYNRESILKAILLGDMLFLSNPHRFTGAIISDRDLAIAFYEAEKHGKLIFIDESLMDFTGLPSPIDTVIRSKWGIIVKTFSTFYSLSGMPLAYGMGSSEMINSLKAPFIPEEISFLAYTAALASLKDKGYRKRTLLFIDGEKRFIKEKLKAIEPVEVIDTPCNFLLIKLYKRVDTLEEKFLERNIIVEAYGEGDWTVIKFPVKSHKYNAAVIKALKAILLSSCSL